MKRLSENEMNKLRVINGYNNESSLCPYCGILLVKVPYAYSEREEEFICTKCFEIVEEIGK